MMEKYFIFIRTIIDCCWYYKQLIKHRFFIFYYTVKICTKLLYRSLIHDVEKFNIREFIILKDVIPLGRRMRKVKYGTIEHKELMNKIRAMNDTHYFNSSHHPEFYKGGFSEMSFLDRVEMIIDWKAASKRNLDGDIKISIENSQEKYQYGDEDKEWMLKIAEEISEKRKKKD